MNAFSSPFFLETRGCQFKIFIALVISGSLLRGSFIGRALKTLKQEPARKVLIQMKSLDKEAEIRPLIIFWDSLHPDGNPEPFFNVAIDDSHFQRLWIFSMSTYVRGLINSGVNELPVHMPNVVDRLDWLNKIYRTDF